MFAPTGLAVRQSRPFSDTEERRRAKYETSSLDEAQADHGVEKLRRAPLLHQPAKERR